MVAAGLLAGCSDSTGPDDTQLTVDAVLADLAEVKSVSAAATTFGGLPIPTAALGSSSACTFNAGSNSFTCPTVTASNVSFDRSFQLFDAAGAPQSSFSRTTTNAIRAITDAAGTFTSAQGSIEFEGHDDYTVSGLLGNTVTIDGSSTSSAIVTGQGTGTIDVTTDVDGLVLARRTGNARRYPQSGSISTHLAIANQQDSFDVFMTITFNGTSIATLSMNAGQGVVTCLIDMSKSNKTPNCT